MAFIDWIFVAFGVGIMLAGGWIQLHPERILPPRADAEQQWSDVALETRALSKIRLLGSCFLFMGVFFALQMTIDLTKLPWWMGTISGFAMAVIAVVAVRIKVRRRPKHGRYFVQQSLPKKVLELR